MRPSPVLLALALFSAACAPALRPFGPLPPVRVPLEDLPEPPAESPPPAAPLALSDEEYLVARTLMVPVDGIRPEQVSDTYWQVRDGGARTHQAVDILAKRGTPVLSADSGTVLRLTRNTLGGITIYSIDSERRFVFYYAHLDRYADGLFEGKPIAQGEVIGYVGTTGNAPKNTPHLHFQVMRYVDARTWWNGPPLDPRPFLVQAGVRGGAVRSTAAMPQSK
ncbi:MAG TPA: M23 family metallopeptidase [Gemmatimonadaceae bacterium]|jgi:murein DD-endopeptidase MepM/ murein hydrolase activator NlpD